MEAGPHRLREERRAMARTRLEAMLAMLEAKWNWLQRQEEGHFEDARQSWAEGDRRGEMKAMRLCNEFSRKMFALHPRMKELRDRIAAARSRV